MLKKEFAIISFFIGAFALLIFVNYFYLPSPIGLPEIINTINTESWKTDILFDEIKIKIPGSWYQLNSKPYDKNVITYGYGIESFITIQAVDKSYIFNKISELKFSGRRIIKRYVLINNKIFIRYDIASEWFGDYGTPAFSTWQIKVDSQFYIISTPHISSQKISISQSPHGYKEYKINELYSTIISSIEKQNSVKKAKNRKIFITF
ncbi:MAG: hypothetical protein Q7R95_07355 [bacterium]|nr:hypothetical protein [bacterium]